jgi:UDP-glucose 4-epimerase
VEKSLSGVELIFHEAAFVSVPQSMEQPEACFDVNVRGTEILLDAAKKAGVRRIVIASSAAVYGDNEIFPLSEDLPTRCLSPYAASKNINEIYAGLFTRSFGLEVTCLRYFNVFGPRQRPDSQYAAAIPIFIHRFLDDKSITIYGDGRQTRDLIYIDDVVQANLIAAEHPAAPGQVFNICSGNETRIIDLVEELQDLFPNAPQPVFAEPRPGDIYRSIGSPAKAYQELGFRTATSLAEGLKVTVEWMRN